ncbi:MAG: hypothetical protein L0J63_01240 [Tetragenococcus koreensis]|nr:hypothetical protein [Tetragenococcus koreensis]
MTETKMKRIGAFIYDEWFPLALCYISLYLACISYRQGRYIFMTFALIAVLIKLIGLILNHRRLRVVGIVCINVVWALTVLNFAQIGQPFYFSLHALLIGLGISIKGRFDE